MRRRIISRAWQLLLVACAVCCLAPGFARAAGPTWSFKTGDIVYSVSVAPDGSLIGVGSRDSSAYALDAGGKLLWKYVTGNAVTSVAVSPDGTYVAVASADSTVSLLTRAGKLVWKQRASGPLGAVALTQGATHVIYGVHNTAALTKDENLYMLDRAGKLVWKSPLSGSPLSIAVTPDAKRIAVGADDDSVTVLDGSGKQLWQQGGGDYMDGVAISPDGKRVAAGSEDKSVYVYDGAGNQLWTHESGGRVHAVALSADAARLAYASEDGTITVLDAKGGTVYRDTTGHLGYASALSGDGQTVVYGLDNGEVGSLSMGTAVAASQAAQRDLLIRVAIGAAVAALLCVLYALFLIRTSRGQSLATRQAMYFRRWAKRLWRARLSYLMLLPTFALLALFNYYPAVSGLYHSLTTWNDDGSSTFIGLDNFRAMGSDPYLTNGFTNLAILLATGLVKMVLFPLIAAEIIFHLRSWRAQYWIRTAFVLPTIVPGVATILVWRFIYDPNLGLLNQFLGGVGLPGLRHSWLGESGYALGSIIFLGFPWITALPLLVLYAGLLSVSSEVLEAAIVDGAGTMRRIWSIHLPLLMGQIKLLFILTFINGLQDFNSILILTGGGPLDSTYVPGVEMYYNITRFSNKGFAAAIGVTLFFAILVVTLIQLRFVRTGTEDEA